MSENDINRLNIVIDCARDLISGENFKGSISTILRRMLEYFKCKRAYVFEFDWEAGTTSNSYEECAENVTSEIDKLQNIPVNTLDYWINSFKEGASIHIRDVSALKDVNRKDYDVLASQGICELFAVPFYLKNTLAGFLGVDDPAENTDDIDMLQTLSNFIFAEIDKEKSYAETESALHKYEMLVSNIHCGLAISEFDNNSHRLSPKFVNKTFLDMLGLQEEEFFKRFKIDPYYGIHPDDRERVIKEFQQTFEKGEQFSSTYRLNNGMGDYIWVSGNASSVSDKIGHTTFYMLYNDITDEKIREQRYNSEINMREQSVDGKAVCAFRYNLTKDCMETNSSSSQYFDIKQFETLDKITMAMTKMIPSKTQRIEFISKLSWTALFDAYLAGNNTVDYECQVILPSGKITWMHNNVKMLKQPHTGHIIAFFSVEDVTMEHVSADMLGMVTKENYDFIVYLDTKHDSYIKFTTADSNMRLQSSNSQYYEADASEYIEKMVVPEEVERTLAFSTIKNILLQLENNSSYEFTVRVKNGDDAPCIKKIQYIYQNKEDGIVIISCCDITEMFRQIEEHQKLADAARRDRLTGLYNKVYFCKLMDEVLKNSGVKQLFFIDIDNFKQFNDKLGHLVGDEVLCDVASTLTSIFFRKDDIVGRFGGDEFFVLLPNASLELAKLRAEKICTELRKEYVQGDKSVKLTVIVGLYSSDAENLSSKEMIENADKAAYLAKQKGKNCFAVYEDSIVQTVSTN